MKMHQIWLCLLKQNVDLELFSSFEPFSLSDFWQNEKHTTSRRTETQSLNDVLPLKFTAFIIIYCANLQLTTFFRHCLIFHPAPTGAHCIVVLRTIGQPQGPASRKKTRSNKSYWSTLVSKYLTTLVFPFQTLFFLMDVCSNLRACC